MPSLKDFEDLIAKTTNVSNQFATTKEGGLAFKGSGGRIATFLSSSYKKADQAVLEGFFQALKDEYGTASAMAGMKKAGLTHRVVDGAPLSIREATLAIREAKVAACHAADLKYKRQYATRDGESRTWEPNSTATKVEGPGLRLVAQDQGEFRLHQWNAKNNPDEKGAVTVELDALVEMEVAAIKTERLKATAEGRAVAPMSDRLIYLQAKLNLTERMVAEACRDTNLKAGGPAANVFLGPDMFFSPSEGPRVAGSCERTTGGACTEEEMKRLTEGLRRISDNHPQVTLMPGTIVWSKPVDPAPIIDGLPRPADMAYNTAPVFSRGNLAHVTYKMTDGGDANTTAVGINGVGGSAGTAPTKDNKFAARLQVFPHDEDTMKTLSEDTRVKVQPILATMAKQADPLSKDRVWEDRLRAEELGPRSPYNTIFRVEGKVMALEICRDHSNRQAQNEHKRLAAAKDPVARLAQSQPGKGGGANLHVLLAVVSTLSPNSTVCCKGGVAAYNDVGKGRAHSYLIKERISVDMVEVDRGKKLEVTYLQHDALKRGPAPEAPRVGFSDLDVKRDDSLRLARPSRTELDPPVVERSHDSGLGPPVKEQLLVPVEDVDADIELLLRPMEGDTVRKSLASSTRPTVALDSLGTEDPDRLTEKRSVRSATGLGSSLPRAPTDGAISLGTKR